MNANRHRTACLWLRAVVQVAVLVAQDRDYRASAEHARGERHPEEVAALLKIKAGFSGWDALEDFGIHLQGWQTDSSLQAAGAADPCTWTFVDSCDSQGRVMQLGLSRYDLLMLTDCLEVNNVSNTDYLYEAYQTCVPNMTASLQDLAAPLNSLAGLGQLSVTGLDLTGSLPPEWGATGGLLSRLRYLDLGGNAITGSIPHAWSWLRDEDSRPMLHMSLADNRLAGTLPAWLSVAFPYLKIFSLQSNDLRGPIPRSWLTRALWTGLERLDLSNNPLGGTLPPAYFHYHPEYQQQESEVDESDVALASLTSLLLYNCSLEGTLPDDWAFHLGALQYLDLGGNQLTGRIPDKWAEGSWSVTGWQKNLNIYLQGNALSGPIPNITEYVIQVRPGNEGLCTPFDTNPSRSTVRFTEDRKQCKRPVMVRGAAASAVPAALGESVNGSGLGRSTWEPPCPLGSIQIKLPQCSTSAGVGWLRQRSVSSPVTAAAVGAVALAAALLVLGVCHQRRWAAASGRHTNHHNQLGHEAKADASASEEDGDLELARLLAHGSRTSSARPWPSGDVDNPTASWRLQSTSLRLKPRDFQVGMDVAGRPVLLGSGAFSKVYRGLLFGHCPVAIKVLNQPAVWQPPETRGQGGAATAPALTAARLHDQQQQQQQQQLLKFWNEADVLRRCLHPNIVQLLGVYSSNGGTGDGCAPRCLMLVTELLEGGSLQERLAAPSLRWREYGGQVALDVARAVAFLHHLSIAHLDIKPANVLLVRSPQDSSSSSSGAHSSVLAKLADVGMSHVLGASMLPGCGTPLFAAPEQLINEPCGLAADLFSLGLVLHGIASGQCLVRRGDARPLRAPQDCPAAVVSLIQSCMHRDPAARPSAAEAVRVLAGCLPDQQRHVA